MKIISTDQLHEKLNEKPDDFYLVDVRDSDEFDTSHISGSINIPWEVITERLKGIKLGREIILYCNTGVRAAKGAKFLNDAGFNNVSVYKGGMEEWNSNN